MPSKIHRSELLKPFPAGMLISVSDVVVVVVIRDHV